MSKTLCKDAINSVLALSLGFFVFFCFSFVPSVRQCKRDFVLLIGTRLQRLYPVDYEFTFSIPNFRGRDRLNVRLLITLHWVTSHYNTVVQNRLVAK